MTLPCGAAPPSVARRANLIEQPHAHRIRPAHTVGNRAQGALERIEGAHTGKVAAATRQERAQRLRIARLHQHRDGFFRFAGSFEPLGRLEHDSMKSRAPGQPQFADQELPHEVVRLVKAGPKKRRTLLGARAVEPNANQMPVRRLAYSGGEGSKRNTGFDAHPTMVAVAPE